MWICVSRYPLQVGGDSVRKVLIIKLLLEDFNWIHSSFSISNSRGASCVEFNLSPPEAALWLRPFDRDDPPLHPQGVYGLGDHTPYGDCMSVMLYPDEVYLLYAAGFYCKYT